MIPWLLLLQIFSFLLLFLFLLNCLTNLWALQKLGTFPAPKKFPRLSILVPARNEEKSIKKCIFSLLNQDYPDFEVLVLNDHSTDRTGEILAKIKNPKLKVFSGQPLPKDWLGKHWACHQLTKKATGELFLFTDADTYHHPSALKAAVSALLYEKADFISALPKEKALTLSELLVIPVLSWSLLTFVPLALAKRTKIPSLSATIGQFMLFKKEAYYQIGGYSAIRKQVLDDVTFGRRIKAYGLKWRIYDGSKYIVCRMYTNFKELSEGMTKSMFPIFKNLIYFFFVWFFLVWTFLGPFLILLLHLFIPVSPFFLYLALASIALTFLTWLISNLRFGYPFLLSFLYPLIIASLAYLSYLSMVYALAGKLTWKGRPIKIFNF